MTERARAPGEETLDPEGNPHTDVHILPEAAQPGDYVVLTVVGVARVQVDPNATIAPGMRLAVNDGMARPLQTRELDGMLVSEGAPTIGVALEAATPGKGLVAVFVSLR